MKLTIDIPVDKYDSFMKKFEKVNYMKVKKIEMSKKEKLIKQITESVEELNKVLRGESKARDVKELLNEL